MITRSRATVFLICVGVCFLLLLNGQVFTNALVFLGCCTTSLIIWIPAVATAERGDHDLLPSYVVLGHLVVIVAVAVSLPGRYDQQKWFNTPVDTTRVGLPPELPSTHPESANSQ